MEEFVLAIRKRLLEIADPVQKEKAERLTSGSICIGIKVPDLRNLAKEVYTELKYVSFSDVLSICDALIKSKCREELLFAFFYLSKYKKQTSNITWDRIQVWLDSIDNWETCDQLSSTVVAPILRSSPEKIDQLMPLVTAANLWKRRFAAATAANINHKGETFPTETFAICQPLLTDSELMVTKAVGWALRELSKVLPLETYTFILNNKSHFSKRLLKESVENLPLEEKTVLLPHL